MTKQSFKEQDYYRQERKKTMFNFGMGELIVVLIIVLLLFGATKLPEIARSLGKSIKEFNKASNEDASEPAEEDKKEETNS